MGRPPRRARADPTARPHRRDGSPVPLRACPHGLGLLGLGSNLGDRRAHLQGAVDALPAAGVEVDASSSVYDTDPVGEVLDQPTFLNACLRVRTALEPLELLDAVKGVERELGRAAEGPAPRPARDRRRRAAARRAASCATSA